MLAVLSPAFSFSSSAHPSALHSFPTRRSSDLRVAGPTDAKMRLRASVREYRARDAMTAATILICDCAIPRSEEHTSELQSLRHLVCRLLLEKKKKNKRKK